MQPVSSLVCERPCRACDAVKLDVEDPLPIRLGHLADGLAGDCTCGVDQHIDAIEPFDCRVSKRFDGFLVGNVAGEFGGIDAYFSDSVRCRSGRVVRTARGDDVRPVSSEDERDRSSDATRSPDNDSRLSSDRHRRMLVSIPHRGPYTNSVLTVLPVPMTGVRLTAIRKGDTDRYAPAV
jgi:hypothetical protein